MIGLIASLIRCHFGRFPGAVVLLGVTQVVAHDHCHGELIGGGTERATATAGQIFGHEAVIFGFAGLGPVGTEIVVTSVDRDSVLVRFDACDTRGRLELWSCHEHKLPLLGFWVYTQKLDSERVLCRRRQVSAFAVNHGLKFMTAQGLEPRTYGLKVRCSTN